MDTRFDVENRVYKASEIAKCVKDHSFAQFCQNHKAQIRDKTGQFFKNGREKTSPRFTMSLIKKLSAFYRKPRHANDT